MIGNMPRSASPVIGDWSDVTWCLVGRGTDTDKQPSERCVGPSSRLHTCDTKTHNKERNSVGGTEMVGGDHLWRVEWSAHQNTVLLSLGIPRLGAPIYSFHATLHIRLDFSLTFTQLKFLGLVQTSKLPSLLVTFFSFKYHHIII